MTTTPDTTPSAEMVAHHFEAMRLDARHHLGLGDIRLTMGDQDRIGDALRRAEAKLREYEDAANTAADERCTANEHHCTCVPLLRTKLREVEAERDGLAEYVATVIANPEDVRPYVNDAIARARALREVVKAATSLEQHELADVPRNLLTPYQARLTSALDAWRDNAAGELRLPDSDARKESK